MVLILIKHSLVQVKNLSRLKMIQVKKPQKCCILMNIKRPKMTHILILNQQNNSLGGTFCCFHSLFMQLTIYCLPRKTNTAVILNSKSALCFLRNMYWDLWWLESCLLNQTAKDTSKTLKKHSLWFPYWKKLSKLMNKISNFNRKSWR